MSLFLDIFGFLTVVLRALILAAQSFALGGLAFLLLLLLPLRPRLSADADEVLRRCRTALRASAFALAGLVAASLALSMTALVGTADASWGEAATAEFARAGFILVAAALLLGAFSGRLSDRARRWALLGLAAVILASQLRLTHAASRPDLRWPVLIADAVHMLAASIWIGGLPCFLIALAVCHKGPDVAQIGRRYSLMSMASVAALAASGVFMSIFYVGSLEALYGASYGFMILTKAALFLLLLGLGGGNFLAVERLRRDPSAPTLRLRRFIEAELGIGLAAFAAAASLTSLPPAVDLADDRASWSEIVERMRPQLPIRFTSPDHDALTISILQEKIAAAEAQKTPAPRAFIPGEGAVLPRNAADVAWSEYNHHWAGVFVLIIGALAMIEHASWGRWARHWPLLFLVMAAFLFVRADEQAWPLGPLGFFESMRDPEVAQHRVIVLLVAVFGIFEWRARTRGDGRGRAALVFPLVVAGASAMLLAHSHAVANVREKLLIEMSHAPLAVLGLVAGWARWLELRLDGRASRVASWVWPLAFVAIGLILLNYREA